MLPSRPLVLEFRGSHFACVLLYFWVLYPSSECVSFLLKSVCQILREDLRKFYPCWWFSIVVSAFGSLSRSMLAWDPIVWIVHILCQEHSNQCLLSRLSSIWGIANRILECIYLFGMHPKKCLNNNDSLVPYIISIRSTSIHHSK